MAGKNSNVTHDRVYGPYFFKRWWRVGWFVLAFAIFAWYFAPGYVFSRTLLHQSHMIIHDYPREGRDSRIAIRSLRVLDNKHGMRWALLFASIVKEVQLPNGSWVRCDGDCAAKYRAKAR
jgi:hypothetical protein